MQIHRSGEIDFLRFLFSVVIVFTHFNDNYHFGFFSNGSIAVEFFFIVSGVLLANHVSRIQNKPKTWDEIADSTWSFTFRKIRSFFRYYLCAIILSLVIRDLLVRHTGLSAAIKNLLRGIPTFTLTFMGLNYSKVSLYVGNTWYLSAMIIAMFILYPLLLKSFDFSTKVLFPLISLFSLGYLYQTYGTITNWNTWTGLCYAGILRAIAEIALGASLYHAIRYIGNRYLQPQYDIPLFKFLFTAVKLVCYGVFLTYTYGRFSDKYFSIHALFICSIGILLSFANVGFNIPDCRITRYLGRISLPIFIFHGFIRWTCKDITGDTAISTTSAMILIGICLILCVFLMYATDFIAARLSTIKFRKSA